MKYSVIFILLLITLICEVNSVEIKCVYRYDSLGYCCDVSSIEISSKNDRKVTKVEGAHQASMTNENVKFFYVNVKIVRYMPTNLEEFFENLEVIQILNSRLVEVSNEDFKPWGDKLKKVWFNSNDITMVPADLFKYNPNMEFIAFYHTKVSHVYDGVFDSLKHLTTLYFESNPCHNANAINNRAEVIKIINEVERKCKDFRYLQRLRDEVREKQLNKIILLLQNGGRMSKEESFNEHQEQDFDVRTGEQKDCNSNSCCKELSAKIDELKSDFNMLKENVDHIANITASRWNDV